MLKISLVGTVPKLRALLSISVQRRERVSKVHTKTRDGVLPGVRMASRARTRWHHRFFHPFPPFFLRSSPDGRQDPSSRVGLVVNFAIPGFAGAAAADGISVGSSSSMKSTSPAPGAAPPAFFLPFGMLRCCSGRPSCARVRGAQSAVSQRCSLLLLQNRGCRPRDFLDERTSGRPRSPFREACPALRLAAGALGGPSAQRRLYAPGALVGRARAVRQGYEGARAKYTVLLDVALLQGQKLLGRGKNADLQGQGTCV